MSKINQKVLTDYADLAARLGLRLNEEAGVLYGTYQGYDVSAAPTANGPYAFAARISLADPVEQGLDATLKEVRKAHKGILALTLKGRSVTLSMRNKGKKGVDLFCDALDATAQALRQAGARPGCDSCGASQSTEVYQVGEGFLHLCPDCAAKLTSAAGESIRREEERPDNMVGGLLGALLGSLIGVVVIVILGQLGYMAVISGLVMGYATLFFYQKFGGKLNKGGIAVCVLVMIAMTYFGHRMDWAISVAQAFEVGIIEAFQAIPDLIDYEIIEGSAYYGNLVLQYVFVAIGAIPTILATRRQAKNKNRIIRIG